MQEIRRRGHLRDSTDVETYLALVRRPIESVSRLIADFARPGRRVVGGRPHDLAIDPTGVTYSSTGD
jgi:hypothetical protein